MLLIGLTGSISTGKSTVSSILSSPPHNLPVVDADLLARKVVEPGTKGYSQIVTYFQPSTPDLLAEDGSLNRAVLGRRVFGDDEERRRDRRVLNGIVHPLVRKEMYKEITTHYLCGHWACVLDIPLLFESSLDLICGAVFVVAVSNREVQLQRLLARDAKSGGDMTREDAERRVLSQMLIEEKTERVEKIYGVRGRGYALLNDGSIDDLREEVGRALEEVRRGRDGLWKWLLWAFPPLAGILGFWICFMNWWWRKKWMEDRERTKAKL